MIYWVCGWFVGDFKGSRKEVQIDEHWGLWGFYILISREHTMYTGVCLLYWSRLVIQNVMDDYNLKAWKFKIDDLRRILRRCCLFKTHVGHGFQLYCVLECVFYKTDMAEYISIKHACVALELFDHISFCWIRVWFSLCKYLVYATHHECFSQTCL